jgi:hypothetical protein
MKDRVIGSMQAVARWPDKNQLDYHETPRIAIDALLDRVSFEGEIWECASGNGAISIPMQERGYQVYSSDIQKECYGDGGVDFLLSDRKTQNVVTNPPFNKMNDFIKHALDVSTGKVCLLSNLNCLSGKGHLWIFRDTPIDRIMIFSYIIPWLKDGVWKSGGFLRHMWLVFDKAVEIGQPKIEWISR